MLAQSMLMTSKSFRALLCTFTLLTLFAVSPAWGEMTEEFFETYPLEKGGAISLENINGDVTVEGWDRDEVEVRAIKRGTDQKALDRVQIEVDATSSRVRIETEYAKSERGSWKWGGGQYASVDYTLKVPRDARISEIELVNGGLEIQSVRGDVEASLVNGNVDASGLAGDVDISTVNGRLKASFDQLANGQSVDLNSVNGKLVLEISESSDAEIKASTVHGAIDNEFGFEVDRGEYVGRSMRGQLGSGAASVDLSNVNGAISVKRN